MTNPEEIIEEVYKNMRKVRWKVPCTDKLAIAGNFNVRVGKVDKWPRVIGPLGVRKCYSNGERLLGLCSKHNLVITVSSSARKINPALNIDIF